MSSWSGRIFAILSIIWWMMLIGLTILMWMARNFMLSPETSWPEALLENAVILGGGGAIWYGFYRFTRRFSERET